ncbi:MAG: hypothetical protein H7068_10995 [Pedobacter sp.]|nr:hypothetical protein [Chitinophagaceae bacterium]
MAIQITIQTTVNAAVEKVWAFWILPEHITKWNNASTNWHTPIAISDTQTKVITTFYSHNSFPLNLMIPIIKKMLKKDIAENASNLKKCWKANRILFLQQS